MKSQIIYKEDEYKIKKEKYYQIGIVSIERNIFKELLLVLKKHLAFFLPELRIWFIKDCNWDDMEKEVIERVDNYMISLEDIKQELTNQVIAKTKPKAKISSNKKKIHF